PHYPPYLTYPQLYGGITVEYRLKSEDNWSIDFDDLESKMSDDVKLLVLINPNNPTGGIITSEEIDRVIEIANKWPNCTIISDEIYDRLNFTNTHISTASRSKSVPVITLNGVSKVYYAPGWRIGYMAIHDPESKLTDVRDGLERLLRSRLCASTPAQKGYLAGLQGSNEWMNTHLEKVISQRNVCINRIKDIEGLEVQKPEGAFYMFVKLTDEMWANDDKKFVLQLLHEEHVLLVHGSGFSPDYGKGHVRLVYLPDEEILNESFDRIDRFLKRHRANISDS
ncbi:MAG: aminotransferase class I/II-fold pyridoxal phosphate-dependent enzyme, partial [Candidatus Thermoplasmatota archaeon]|nr:aminotransferase class I/II-fold pyridoxal phosphate-dependent enzyme [Candidatus Thermoplasmatota archaeon]